MVFTGYVERIADAYAAADVVVNPGRHPEGLGRAALEALAAQRPVVASRIGGISEALRDGVDALLVEPGDPEALADAIARVWQDDALARELVSNGRTRVSAVYAVERGAETFAALVDDLLPVDSDASRE